MKRVLLSAVAGVVLLVGASVARADLPPPPPPKPPAKPTKPGLDATAAGVAATVGAVALAGVWLARARRRVPARG